MDLINQSSFAAERTVLLDRDGSEVLVVIVKATYQFAQDGKLSVCEEQVPILMADEFHGEPGQSSLKYQSDLSLAKRGTDIALLGHAYAKTVKTKSLAARLRLGSLDMTVCVFGDRTWEKTLGLYRVSGPLPFEKIPLTYERSFGGGDNTNPNPAKQGYEVRNPVGTGYRTKFTKQVDGTKLPNLEHPNHFIKSWKDHPAPMGFGFIGRDWEPRRKFAGTYDDSWLRQRNPLLPNDFDDRYYNGAHPELMSKEHLRGDEWVAGENLARHGTFRFQLPRITPCAIVLIGNEEHSPNLELDTLIIEPDLARILIVWRGILNIHRRIYRVKSVRVFLNT